MQTEVETESPKCRESSCCCKTLVLSIANASFILAFTFVQRMGLFSLVLGEY